MALPYVKMYLNIPLQVSPHVNMHKNKLQKKKKQSKIHTKKKSRQSGQQGQRKAQYKQQATDQKKQERQNNVKKKTERPKTDRRTLCYFTARTDGSHTPKCLLEGCIYMETAITIGQMLQDDRMKHRQSLWTFLNLSPVFQDSEGHAWSVQRAQSSQHIRRCNWSVSI